MATAAVEEALVADSAVNVNVNEKVSGPLKVPLAAPAPDCQPRERPALTAEQQQKYDWLLERVKAWTEIPSAHGKAGPPTDTEKFWLTRECLLRYLRATKWHEKEAEKRLAETLAWRRDYGVEELTAEHISPENETGKQIILGYDREARVCHYLSPGRQNTDPSPRQVQHLVFMVERVIDLMPPGQETLALLINYKPSKTHSNTTPGIGLAREVLHILQHHYPERLGKALIINMPWFVHGFFKLITPFIDPHTREKLKFNEDMSQYVPPEQMWTDFSSGTLAFEYDHAVYWPVLQKLCGERRAARWQRWAAGGRQLGESEDYLAGAVGTGVAGALPAEAWETVQEEDTEGNGDKTEEKREGKTEQKPEEKPEEKTGSAAAAPPPIDETSVPPAAEEKTAEVEADPAPRAENGAALN